MHKTLSFSKYSHLFRSTNGMPLVYNSECNSFLVLTEDSFLVLERSVQIPDEISLLSESIVDLLIKHRIVIQNHEDDSYFYKQKKEYYRRVFDTNTLCLTIVPTGDCNFDCPYCFESKKQKGKMSNETIGNLISFVKRKNLAKRISIMWYGGEPLMAFDTIKIITNKIKAEVGIPIINHQIVTNGYYLNEDVCDFFNENNFVSIQLTLDGSEDTHNRSRCLKQNGSPTFQVILSKIQLLLDRCKKIKIKIRINVSQNNLEEYMGLKRMLVEHFGDSLFIYPGIIRIYDESKSATIPPSLSQTQQQDLFLADTFSKQLPPRMKKGCKSANVYSFIIGVKGEMYKCWEDVNDPEGVVGYLDNNTSNSLLYKYEVGTSCFENKDCEKCFFLPICNGGCPKQRMKNYFENGTFDLCTLYKDNLLLDKCLQQYFEKKSQNIESKTCSKQKKTVIS